MNLHITLTHNITSNFYHLEQLMKDNGNIKVNAIYEKAVPDCWVKPTSDCSL